jgi:hypothetical protein
MDAPKLLLDTNIYLALAKHALGKLEGRFRQIAACRTPPLFWTCATVFEELTGHIHRRNAAKFDLYRRSLGWMDDLCGNGGVAEDLAWILSRGVFANALPYDDDRRAGLNAMRRAIIRAPHFDDVPEKIRSAIEAQRADHLAEVERWVRQMQTFVQMLKSPRAPRVLTVQAETAIPEGIVDLATRTALEYHGFWGTLQSREEIKERQREYIAFELAFVMKCGNRLGYNVRKYANDYNDALLCRYPCAGYTLVTTDRRMIDTLRQGRCREPRVIGIEEALKTAEAWLASCPAAAAQPSLNVPDGLLVDVPAE